MSLAAAIGPPAVCGPGFLAWRESAFMWLFIIGGAVGVFEAAVDRFGGSVAGAGPVEVGQHVDCTLGQGPSEPTAGSRCRVRRPRSRSGLATVSEARSAHRGRDGRA